MSYAEFLESKKQNHIPTGLVEVPDLSVHLFPFQSDIVRWALKKGRKFVGCELKGSYFKQACSNLRNATNDTHDGLFSTEDF